MKRHNKLISGLILTCFISTAGFFYSKNVQATKLTNELRTALQHDNYDNAEFIYEKVSKDIFISKLFNFNEKAGSLTQEQYEALKKSYLEDSITYDEFNSKVDVLKKFNSFHEDKNETQAIEKMEGLRSAYRMAEASVLDKDYKGAVESLKKIENIIDAVYKDKVSNLKVKIGDLALKETEVLLNDYIAKGDYAEGIKLIESKRDLMSNDYITVKTKELNTLNSREKAKQSIKKKNPKLIAYLADYVPNLEKENAILAISSRTSFLVWVDIHTQSTNVFIGNKGDWKLIHSFLSSTGKPSDETPAGTYTIKDKGMWFFSEKYQEGAKYWVKFKGNYLFHSLPMNQNKQVVDSTLGEPASHGCVRLGIDDAAWFYNNIPTGTTVYIK
jgi:lipoprotein-anchoring transpeptidase ErfK/SrfK